ncbi:hypothetical protein [uncultured Deefgea sp.]|uniref:hypothetical protein n=1 Tax=uncultured Deefgea sp. TaxID=1304914 RepID=UPI0025971638|nr:hypothetical protein [uncultured Deefgea sp.]
MSNHEADMKNKNIGTPGTNITLDHNQRNRGEQLRKAVQVQPKPKSKITKK